MRHRVRRLTIGGLFVIGAMGVVAPAGPASAGPPPPPVFGDLFFVSSGTGATPSGVYNVDPDTADATLIRPSGAANTPGAFLAAAETPIPAALFASQPNGILVIDLDGPETGFAPGPPVWGLALDIETGLVYGAWGPLFFTVDPQTAAQTYLPPPDPLLTGLAWREGLVYGVTNNGLLLSYDPGPQTWTTVGTTGLGMSIDNGLAWNPVLDIFYAVDEDGDLYTIDPTDGTTTLVGSTGIDAGGGLAFIPPSTDSQPDGRIQKPGGGDVGDDVYGVGQTVTRTTPKGVVTEHLVKFQNDGSQHQAYVIDGDHGVADWRVRYRVRNQPVTDAVVSGEYVTRVLAPGEIFRMRVRVKPQGNAPIGGDGFAVEVSAANGDAPPLTDAVRAVTVAVG